MVLVLCSKTFYNITFLHKVKETFLSPHKRRNIPRVTLHIPTKGVILFPPKRFKVTSFPPLFWPLTGDKDPSNEALHDDIALSVRIYYKVSYVTHSPPHSLRGAKNVNIWKLR